MLALFFQTGQKDKFLEYTEDRLEFFAETNDVWRYFTTIFAALSLITGRNELSLEVRNEQYRKLMAKGLEFFHETPIIKSAIEQLPNKTMYHGWLFVEGEMWIALWKMYPIGS